MSTTSTMQAVRFHDHGGPEELVLDEVEVPTPASGQVRVRVAATTFNGVDANIRAGFMQGPIPVTLPHTPGLDVAGTVDALGPDVTGWAVGDAVVGFLPMVEDGAAAQHVLAPADVLARAPRNLPLVDAAAFPLVALTARQALVEHAGLRAGQRILVNGAGGAVGAYAVQLAKLLGAEVVAVTGPDSRDLALARGADQVVDHTVGPVGDALTEPVDVLLNLAPVEPEAYAYLVEHVRDGGVVVGTTVWMPTPGDETRGVRSVDLFVESDAARLTEIVERIDRGELVVDVARRVPLADLARLHAEAAEGGVHGKVVVVVDDRVGSTAVLTD